MQKYAHDGGCETWEGLASVLVEDVCRDLIPADDKAALVEAIRTFKFLPGGRYLRNAGRPLKFFSNCFALRAEEDTREDWAALSFRSESCLISGGGIGTNYSVYRGRGAPLKRTGGVASGPIPAMEKVNEIGRRVMQGGSRRSAIYASLDREHADVLEFLHAKDWHLQRVPGAFTADGKPFTIADAKAADQNFPAPLDHTNVSVNYSDEWLALGDVEARALDPVFRENVWQAVSTSEPGFSFNFGAQRRHTLRNACTEFITDDDSDVCNLGSVNMARIESVEEFAELCRLGAAFLYCGTITGLAPNEKSAAVRDRNRRIGLGLMGVHEWLVQRGARYEMTPELRAWLAFYESESKRGADAVADRHGLPRSKAYRAIAPTGTIGMLAGTTTGIEPVFAVAMLRRYLKAGRWVSQIMIESMARDLVERLGVDPESIESALSLAEDVERRVRFQADVQDFVDMGISSTINLPAWGSALNNEDRVDELARVIATYAPRLRGLTFYADGSRGGQPLTRMLYRDAIGREGVEMVEHESCKGGVCGA